MKFTQTIEYKFDYVPTIRDGLMAYKLQSKDSLKDKKSTSTGFVLEENLPTEENPLPIEREGEWHYCKPKMLEELRLWGWSGKEGDYSHFNLTYDDVYQAAKQNRGKLVREDGSSHMIFDHEDKPLPVAIHFDYIEANIRDGAYDLSEVEKILIKRKDIFFQNRLHVVRSVPYYNISEGCNHYIQFIWQPSVKDYRKMWDKCLELSDKCYPSTERYRAIWELDLLGIRKAAYHESFHEG